MSNVIIKAKFIGPRGQTSLLEVEDGRRNNIPTSQIKMTPIVGTTTDVYVELTYDKLMERFPTQHFYDTNRHLCDKNAVPPPLSKSVISVVETIEKVEANNVETKVAKPIRNANRPKVYKNTKFIVDFKENLIKCSPKIERRYPEIAAEIKSIIAKLKQY